MFFRKKEEEVLNKPKKKEVENEFEWDKKRIFITLFFAIVVILVGLELKKIFLPNTKILGDAVQNKQVNVEKPTVKAPNINVSSQVESTIKDIKNSIESLNPSEVASSSPQIQKVLQDIQGIKDLPSNQAREM